MTMRRGWLERYDNAATWDSLLAECEAEVRELRAKLVAREAEHTKAHALLAGEIANRRQEVRDLSTKLAAAEQLAEARRIENVGIVSRNLLLREKLANRNRGIAFEGLSESQLAELKRLGGPLHVHRGAP